MTDGPHLGASLPCAPAQRAWVQASLAGLGATIDDYAFSPGADVLVVSIMSGLLLTGAIWAFNRQE